MGTAALPEERDAGRRRVAAYAVVLFAVLGVIGAGARIAWLPRPPAAAPGMVRVQGGPLAVKTAAGAATVRIRTLEVDRTEVTAASYRACVEADVCKPPRREAIALGGDCNFDDPARASHPMNCVSVAEAIAYCEWRDARLPTTNEWRYLAHGSASRPYPWGDAPPEASRLNACGRECEETSSLGYDDGARGTAPVGSFPEGSTPEGLLDMAGNVEEWACDLDPEQEEFDDVACWTFTELGGSFKSNATAPIGSAGRGSGRYWREDYRDAMTGFRCVR